MSSVVVVNPQLEYWGEISLHKAIVKLVKEKADILAHTNQILGHYNDKTPIYYPLVIQFRRLIIIKYKSSKIHFGHSAVFDRDDNFCQYWHYDDSGKRLIYRCAETDRTIDHVFPVSRGGKRNDFKNAVCCCRHCNEIIKKNRTPEEAGLKLVRLPIEPKRIIGDRIIKRFVYNPIKESHVAFAKIRPDLL